MAARRSTRRLAALPEILALWHVDAPPPQRRPTAEEREHVTLACYGLSEYRVRHYGQQRHCAAWLRWATEGAA